jgi:LysR family nitrogen assimilation transcriptional regulator
VAVTGSSEGPVGRVTLGLPGSTARLIASQLLRRTAQHPGILLELVERPSAELVDLLSRGRLDLGIAVDCPPSARGVRSEPLLDEELFFICSAAASPPRRSISLRAVAGYPLILPSLPSTIRQRLDAAFLEDQLQVVLAAEASATDLVVRLVRDGLGATVLPWAAVAEEAARKEVRAVPITGLSLTRKLSVCLPSFVEPTRACDAVRRLLQETVDELLAASAWRGVRVPQR